MSIKSDLAKIVGKDYVTDSMEERKAYSTDYSLFLQDCLMWLFGLKHRSRSGKSWLGVTTRTSLSFP